MELTPSTVELGLFLGDRIAAIYSVSVHVKTFGDIYLLLPKIPSASPASFPFG